MNMAWSLREMVNGLQEQLEAWLDGPKTKSVILDDGTTAQLARMPSGHYLVQTAPDHPMIRPDGSKQHWHAGRLQKVELADGSVMHYRPDAGDLLGFGDNVRASEIDGAARWGRMRRDMPDQSVIHYLGAQEKRTYPDGLIETRFGGELAGRENPQTGFKQIYVDRKLAREVLPDIGEIYYGKDGFTQHTAPDGTQTNKINGVTQSVTYPDKTRIIYEDGVPRFGHTADRRSIDFIEGQPFLRPTFEEEQSAFAPAQSVRREVYQAIAVSAMQGTFDVRFLSTPEELGASAMFNKTKMPRPDDIARAFCGDAAAQERTMDFLSRVEACFNRVVQNPQDPLGTAYPGLGAQATQVRQLEEQARTQLRVPFKEFAHA
jgi:hypothetical protein